MSWPTIKASRATLLGLRRVEEGPSVLDKAQTFALDVTRPEHFSSRARVLIPAYFRALLTLDVSELSTGADLARELRAHAGPEGADISDLPKQLDSADWTPTAVFARSGDVALLSGHDPAGTPRAWVVDDLGLERKASETSFGSFFDAARDEVTKELIPRRLDAEPNAYDSTTRASHVRQQRVVYAAALGTHFGVVRGFSVTLGSSTTLNAIPSHQPLGAELSERARRKFLTERSSLEEAFGDTHDEPYLAALKVGRHLEESAGRSFDFEVVSPLLHVDGWREMRQWLQSQGLAYTLALSRAADANFLLLDHQALEPVSHFVRSANRAFAKKDERDDPSTLKRVEFAVQPDWAVGHREIVERLIIERRGPSDEGPQRVWIMSHGSQETAQRVERARTSAMRFDRRLLHDLHANGWAQNLGPAWLRHLALVISAHSFVSTHREPTDRDGCQSWFF